MLGGAGYQVMDLGIDVSKEKFLETVQKERPNVLGMSAMLTTTMMEMKRVIDLLSAQGERKNVKVIVGGAPINAHFASEIGADGYGPDAAVAVDLVKKLTR